VGGHSMVCEAGDAGGVICDVAHDGVGLLGAVECCSVGCEAGGVLVPSLMWQWASQALAM